MNVLQPMGRYLGSVLSYFGQMLPCMLAGLVVFLCLRPARRDRLTQRGLYSGPCREAALALFVVFCAGLAALTLFPANFWDRAMGILFMPPDTWAEKWAFLAGLYPAPGEVMAGVARLPDMLSPLQEIRRALRHGSWLMFMLWGNIVMFLPIGFCTGLLWRNNRWWKSALIGCGCSAGIEFIQFFIGRSTDIDDVILNTTGALAGYWLFLLLQRLAPRFTEKFRCCRREDCC